MRAALFRYHQTARANTTMKALKKMINNGSFWMGVGYFTIGILGMINFGPSPTSFICGLGLGLILASYAMTK